MMWKLMIDMGVFKLKLEDATFPVLLDLIPVNFYFVFFAS
jgi:hypothetical protein